MEKGYEEINEKIRKNEAVVMDAEEIIDFVEQNGVKKAVKEVDIVTTATFGPMCSSGVFLNLGHSDPPIRIKKAYLNGVEAYAGIAAVDIYLGATATRDEGYSYGGAHVIQDLIDGKEVELVAEAHGTDCYPRKKLKATITLEGINQAILFNPRNCYQNYAVATNSSDRTIYTYMGKLLPNFGNAAYSTTGQLSPLINDPYYETIGVGTRIFLGGATGYVVSEGTQHNPSIERNMLGIPTGGAATLAVTGNLKEMNSEYLKACSFKNYGTSLYVGIGVPIPILNEKILTHTCIRNKDIITNIYDYSIPRRSRPSLGTVNYEELMSGWITLNGKEVKTGCKSSYAKAKEITKELKKRIEKGEFFIQKPIRRLPLDGKTKPLNRIIGE